MNITNFERMNGTQTEAMRENGRLTFNGIKKILNQKYEGAKITNLDFSKENVGAYIVELNAAGKTLSLEMDAKSGRIISHIGNAHIEKLFTVNTEEKVQVNDLKKEKVAKIEDIQAGSKMVSSKVLKSIISAKYPNAVITEAKTSKEAGKTVLQLTIKDEYANYNLKMDAKTGRVLRVA